MQTRHHGADRAVHDIGDFFVGEFFHVRQNHREAKFFRKLGESPMNLFFDDGAKGLVLGIAQRAHRGSADPTVGKGIRIGTIENDALEAPAAVLLMKVLVRILKSHALRLVPAWY